jgi:hypothetical protein
MKTRGVIPQPLIVPVSLAVGVLLGLVTLAVQAQELIKKVEIVIKDGTATVISGHTYTGLTTEIIVRNEDTIAHGFNASLIKDNMEVKMEGGSLAEGKGPHVYRIGAGKTMMLKFILPHQERSETVAFWCDMHHALKGEMLVVEFTGLGGG